MLKLGINVENVISILSISQQRHDNNLRTACCEFIFQRFAAVSRTRAFKSLDKETLVSLLKDAQGHWRLKSAVAKPISTISMVSPSLTQLRP